MSKNVMEIARIQNNVSRNGFDLSYRNLLSGNVGELIPFDVREVVPGDKFKLSPQVVTRTSPLNAASYTRFKEYVDYFFVPFHQMWRFSENFTTQLPNTQHSTGLVSDAERAARQIPCFSAADFVKVLRSFVNYNPDAGEPYFLYDDGGNKRDRQMVRLANLLGYGDFSQFLDVDFEPSINGTTLCSLFPYAAYQKIYSDYFRYDQWELSDPNTFNFDYVLPSMSPIVDVTKLSFKYNDTPLNSLFDMRYCNFPLDYFTGLLPSPQYGDTANVYVGSTNSIDGPATMTATTFGSETGRHTLFQSLPSRNLAFSNDTSDLSINIPRLQIPNSSLDLSFDILSLRKAQALQKYREIIQSNKYNLKSQYKAIWNVNVDKGRDDRCRYVGGFNNVLNINPVVNSNLADTQQASYSGFCSGTCDGNIEFESTEFGILMGIYHCVPLADYKSQGLNALNRKVNFSDYANPIFDKIGMQDVPLSDFSLLTQYYVPADDETIDYGNVQKPMGYAPRFVDYKTTFDRLSTGFIRDFLTYRSCVDFGQALANNPELSDFFTTGELYYRCFKVSKYCTKDIFSAFEAVDNTHPYAADNFLIQFDNNCYAVRNFDVNGLPY